MNLIKYSIIVTNTNRSLVYLKKLSKIKINPSEIIYLDNNKNLTTKNILKKNKFFFPHIKVKKFLAVDLDGKVAKYLLKKKEKYIIYSGYPGVIVKNKKLLKNKKLIHSHPGKLPNYKGSTTIYYSLLNEKKIYCSTIVLNNKIDEGQILLEKKYKIPKKIETIDKKYDDHIRSNNIIFLLRNLTSLKKRKQNNKNFQKYYVIHPLLRSIVFKKF